MDNKPFAVCNKTKILYNPREPIYIKADKDRISQVIYNLLNNALIFTEGGTIIIDVQNNIDSVVEDSIVVLVKDTGIGSTRNTTKIIQQVRYIFVSRNGIRIVYFKKYNRKTWR